jgi:hypothetical protein
MEYLYKNRNVNLIAAGIFATIMVKYVAKE